MFARDFSLDEILLKYQKST